MDRALKGGQILEGAWRRAIRGCRGETGNWGLKGEGHQHLELGGKEEVSTHPVAFHTHVTFEARKAILALRNTGREDIMDDGRRGGQRQAREQAEGGGELG